MRAETNANSTVCYPPVDASPVQRTRHKEGAVTGKGAIKARGSWIISKLQLQSSSCFQNLRNVILGRCLCLAAIHRKMLRKLPAARPTNDVQRRRVCYTHVEALRIENRSVAFSITNEVKKLGGVITCSQFERQIFKFQF